jgi:hypothetical protein
LRRDAAQSHRASIAYHEAAHFVACRVVGCGRVLRMRRLSLGERGRPVGRSLAYEKPDPAPAEIEDLVTILFAGRAASRRRSGPARPVTAPRTRDDRKAERLLAQLGDPRAEGRLRRRAQRIVSRHWKEIEVLGRALLRRSTLEVDEAHALLDGQGKGATRRTRRSSR